MIDLDHLNANTCGLLFVGDPHVWSHKPGRRRDHYLSTICGKLEQIVEISNRDRLWVVILGDLFHQAEDNNLAMISRLSAIFQQFERKPIVLVGNHDLTEQTLTQGTVLEVFHSVGLILTMMENKPFARVTLQTDEGEKRIVLGGTPYGFDAPKNLQTFFKGKTAEELKKDAKADTIIWLTHDDYAFDHTYPNAVPLHPIVGVDMVINGHIHGYQKPIMVGDTAWYNPGNIARISIDLMDQVVAVWSFTGAHKREMASNDVEIPRLTQIPLKHAKGSDVMSLEGYHTKKAQEAGEISSKPQTHENVGSLFVAQLQEEEHQRKTDEGVLLRETLDDEYRLTETPEHIKKIVDHLFEQTILRHQQGLS